MTALVALAITDQPPDSIFCPGTVRPHRWVLSGPAAVFGCDNCPTTLSTEQALELTR